MKELYNELNKTNLSLDSCSLDSKELEILKKKQLQSLSLDNNEMRGIVNTINTTQHIFYTFAGGSKFVTPLRDFMKEIIEPWARDIAKKHNPHIYNLYQGNMCTHLSFFYAYFLNLVHPVIQWEIVNATLSFKKFGKEVEYEHSFIAGTVEKDIIYNIDLWNKFCVDFFIQKKEITYFNRDVPCLTSKLKKINKVYSLDTMIKTITLEDDMLMGNLEEHLIKFDKMIKEVLKDEKYSCLSS